MSRYIIKRLLLMIPVILGISIVIFALMDFAPGDPAQIQLGSRATEEALNAFREQYGLNDPFWIRYFRYLWNALHGDMGVSYRTGIPVVQEIIARVPITLKVAAGALALVLIIGIPIGIISAVKQYSVMDNLTLVFALVLSSMPNFWLGTMLILLFAMSLSWFPVTFSGNLRSYVLPWFSLASAQLASMVRNTRSNMLEVIRADYIKLARSKGVAELQIVVKHALRNALMPIVTILGMNFLELLGGTVVIEQLFAIPGLSSLALTSVRKIDIPVVMGIVIFVALLGGFINLFIDIIYVYIDPRLKVMYTKKKEKKGGNA